MIQVWVFTHQLVAVQNYISQSTPLSNLIIIIIINNLQLDISLFNCTPLGSILDFSGHGSWFCFSLSYPSSSAFRSYRLLSSQCGKSIQGFYEGKGPIGAPEYQVPLRWMRCYDGLSRVSYQLPPAPYIEGINGLAVGNSVQRPRLDLSHISTLSHTYSSLNLLFR